MDGISVELTADNLDQVLEEFAEQVEAGLEMIGMHAKKRSPHGKRFDVISCILPCPRRICPRRKGHRQLPAENAQHKASSRSRSQGHQML